MKYTNKWNLVFITNYSQSFLAGFLFLLLFVSSAGCKKYLDARPDKQLVIPSTIADARALLDNYLGFNSSYPFISGQSDDDYYLNEAAYNSLPEETRNNYIWAAEAINASGSSWNPLYQAVYNANIALETLDRIQPGVANSEEWKATKGTALFLRAFLFYQVAQHFAQPYKTATAATDLGIPLRLNSDPTVPSVRSTVAATWQQIRADLVEASRLLPVSVSIASRPSRAAGYALLARVCLDMEDYIMSGKYADSSLQLSGSLIDYNSISPASVVPFQLFNTEVLFTASTFGAAVFGAGNWKTDSTLYESYEVNDLRKSLFFRAAPGGGYSFKGNYDGNAGGQLFVGLAIDEVWLTRAECRARLNDKDGAMNDLNELMIKRWASGSFTPRSANTAEEALLKVLEERRKELVGRGTRWFDLRRLNKDPRFARTLTRIINGQTYTLPPNDPRYTHLIPADVIAATGMQQNQR